MLKVVTIGGGNGQSCTLRALKHFLPQVSIISVVSVSDSGGSSGRLREQFNILPVGDLLRAILALSSYPYEDLREIFYSNRFVKGALEGHNAGNLLLTFMYQQSGNWLDAINSFSEILKVQGRVLPVTLDLTHLCTELENGRVIKGESNIGQISNECYLHKTRLWLDPPGQVLLEVTQAIAAADYVILGPGDLYTSIIPALLVEGMAEALNQNKAPLIYFPNNANRQGGETCGFKTGDYVREMQKYVPRHLDWLVVQDANVKPNLAHFEAKKWEPVEIDDGDWRREHQIIVHDLSAKEAAGLDWQQMIEPLGKITGLN